MKTVIERSALWIAAAICLAGQCNIAAAILFGVAVLSLFAEMEETKKSK